MNRLQAGIYRKTIDSASYFMVNDLFVDYHSNSDFVPERMIDIAEIWREDIADLVRFGHMVIVSRSPGLEYANNRWEKHPTFP